MKQKLTTCILCLLLTSSLMAVPAYPGWQTKTQPDGTTIEVRLNGDEFYHFYTNRAGDIVAQSADGYWRITEKRPTAETIAMRRKASPMLKDRPKKVGRVNLAPRGLFILVNFKDSKFQSSNTQAEMDKMMNADSYTYNGAYGSVRKYFIDQSGGAYTPTFDVVGPVTLSKKCSYYGENGTDGNDKYAADMVIEACKLADTQFGVDFTQYDNDNDGNIDFVYIIYAGKGEADGGAASTIWPHNWDIKSAIHYGNCTYQESDCKVDGLAINDYACSGELNGKTGKRNSIGTLCHEFSHVLGLPDYYVTNYDDSDDSNYTKKRTPRAWDIMDTGNYNGDGNYPPNYSAHEKYFLGWHTPVNIGNTPSLLTLNANGTSGYNSYQMNADNTLQTAIKTGVNYYIENRQQTGWDTCLPGHGLIVWYVDYNLLAWYKNEPNNTAGSPRYTIISATGSQTGLGTDKDPYPGTGNRTSVTIADKPLTSITETNGVISLVYIQDPKSLQWEYEVAYEHCTVSSESGAVKKGETLTLTVVPEEGYMINSAEHIEITMGGKALTYNEDFTYANNTLTIPAVAGDLEIYIMPELIPIRPYTVSWIADGELIEEQHYAADEALRMPSATVIACEGMTFIGWTTQANFYDPFATPEDLFSSVTAQKVNDNITFYAVYK